MLSLSPKEFGKSQLESLTVDKLFGGSTVGMSTLHTSNSRLTVGGAVGRGAFIRGSCVSSTRTNFADTKHSAVDMNMRNVFSMETPAKEIAVLASRPVLESPRNTPTMLATASVKYAAQEP